ncbi:MAG: tetratricopeptide repeat protein [Bryobacteraceae bacterium]|jgi:tetratricopeptide (TPR) repeat protein
MKPGLLQPIRFHRLKPVPPLIVFCLAMAVPLAAQTLDQAESLWKARRYQEANEVFKALVAGHRENAHYRVRWGRLYLDHWQPAEANGLFDEALKLDPKSAEAMLGEALLAAESFAGEAAELAHKALALDPKLVEAQELLARLALEDDDRDRAAAEAHRALALDPQSVEAKAILAAIDWLEDKKDSPWDPKAARGYATAGHFFMLNRRYVESVAYYRKAIALDPQLYAAQSQLAINLMRLGQDREAQALLKDCWDHDFQDSATANSLRLLDSYKNYLTFRTGRTILKLHKKEAELLHPYFEAEMERVIATYEKKYRFHLPGPVQVEVYPDHEDFAVRTMGMPGLGALGVTFDMVIAMDSPSGRPPGSFHWASTLWHEMSHVFTLTMTQSHVPRWFTEGIAVHEETAASPEWGDRLGPDEIAAIQHKQLLPVADLDRGFVHPKNPAQVVVSYYQAGKICDYIAEKWGWDTILAMLADFGRNQETGAVIRKELKIPPEEFDKEFLAKVEAETGSVTQNFDRWRAAARQVTELEKKKDYDGTIKLGREFRDLYPEYVEAGSLYEALAEAEMAKGDKPAAIGEWERYVHMGGRNPETIEKLAGALMESGKGKEAADILNRLNWIYPEDNLLHQRLGGLWLDESYAAGAVREFHALVSNHPVDPAEAHYELARAYSQNRQRDQARDEVLAALEIAPDFKPAQKLFLELQ